MMPIADAASRSAGYAMLIRKPPCQIGALRFKTQLKFKMRRLEFDQWEFPDPCTEERLVLTIESKKIADEMKRFLSGCDGGLDLIAAVEKSSEENFSTIPGNANIADHLLVFAGIQEDELMNAKARRCYINPDGDIVLIETPTRFVLYEWSTSA